MIIFSEIKLEVGKVYGPNTIEQFTLNVDGERIKDFRFMVMREATREEYTDYYKRMYGKSHDAWTSYFYQISVD